MFAIYIHFEIRKKKTVLSSLQACFLITPSSGDFVAKNIRNHPLHTLQICMICVAVVSMLSLIVMQKTTNYTFAYVLCTKISRKKIVSKWNFAPLSYSLKVKWRKKNGIYALNPWVVESLFRLWYTCKTWTTPIFPPRGSVFLFQSRTRLVLIQFLRHTAFIS